MSKLTKQLNTAKEVPFVSDGEVLYAAEKAARGDKTRSQDECRKTMDAGTNALQQSFTQFDVAFVRMMQQEVDMIQRTKNLTSNVKNYIGQIGEAMARIDRVVVHDFERKLVLLERFATATKTLAELSNEGHLDKIATALK